MWRYLLVISVLFLLTIPCLCQYYIRGEVRNQQGNPLPHVLITQKSKNNYPFYSGSTGVFGIPTTVKKDSLTFSLDGYETIASEVDASVYSYFTLKQTTLVAKIQPHHRASVTKNYKPPVNYSFSAFGESYSSTFENNIVTTTEFPETGFALHVDRASYSNIRRFLNQDSKPPTDAVRIEEMLNYFNFRTAKIIDTAETFTTNTYVTSCPWNEKSRLFFINVQSRKINLDNTPPSNLVFLLDVSGSMDMPNRLPLLKNGFKLLVENLRDIDTVSIITYSSTVGVLLPPTSGSEKMKIIEALEGVRPAGSTAGEAAIRLAYKYARNNFRKNGNNRVILATDGDFNVGQTTDKELEELIRDQRNSGVYLTCLGVGMGNYKDSKLEVLAKKGNGNFAYLDKEKEAEKVLVEEFTQTVYSVANDVFLNVRFNPAMVGEYRLIGFDNKKEALEDSTTELEGGEVGSGHTMLAVFEINMADNPASTPADTSEKNRIATLELTYKLRNNAGKPDVIQYIAPYNYQPIQKADSSLQFATSVVMFGSLLKQSNFVKKLKWDDIFSLAKSAANTNDLLQMEFVNLISKAKEIYSQRKKRKKREP